MSNSVAIPRPSRTISSYATSNPASIAGGELDSGVGSFEPNSLENAWGARTINSYTGHKRLSGIMSEDGNTQVHVSPLRRGSNSGSVASPRHSSGRMRQPLFGESFRTEEDGIPVKTVIVGESAVGKSSLAIRLCKGIFYESMQNTVGAAYLNTVVAIGQKKIKFELWDTAGQERYHSLAPMYYRDAAIAIIVYDITCKKSFQKAKNWVSELQTQMNASEMIPILALVGNKADLSQKRQVSIEEAQQFAMEEHLVWMETSAATGANVHNLFVELVKEIPEEALALPDPLENTASGRFLSCGRRSSNNSSSSSRSISYRGGIGSSTPRGLSDSSGGGGGCSC